MSLMFRASRLCIRASETGEALARWAIGSKTLMLSPVNDIIDINKDVGRNMPLIVAFCNVIILTKMANFNH